ncbi:MAG: PPOX class F420-dependent oxidoreductase [Actinomycetes bacterium]
MAGLTDAQAQILLDPNFAVIATVRPDGSPQSSVVWIDWDGEAAVFTTTRPRAKGRYLERDPRVSISVFDLENPYRYVEIQGVAELSDDGAAEHIHAMSHKYSGADYPEPDGRLLVRVKPVRVHAMGVE